MNKTIISVLIIAVILFVNVAFAARTSQIFNEDGDYILPQTDATHYLGSNSFRFLGLYTTALDVSGAFTLGGTVGSGGIDMNNYLITNIGVSTTDFTSGGGLNLAGELSVTGTSTLATTTIVGTVGITGAFTATTIGGITEANLLDKSATETITGAWIFDSPGATSTVTIGSASTTACLRMWAVDDTGYTYFVSASPGVALTTTTAAVCGY